MGYYVREIKGKKTRPNWKVQFISSKKDDQKRKSKAKNPKRTWDLNKERWRPLGFHSSMTFAEATVRAKQLNCQILIQRQEERIKIAEEKAITFKRSHEALLPEEFAAEFEQRFICRQNFLNPTQQKSRLQQRQKLWRSAQKMIAAVGHEPVEWFYYPDRFYEYICELQYSIGYARAVIAKANLWGHFITRKMGQPFYPIRSPQGYERQKILEAHYSKKASYRKPSLPITPAHLDVMKPRMKPVCFNWIFISVWLGLRPNEIDNLHDRSMWRIETTPTTQILWVFQTKIVALPPDDRWKPIPILFDEQRFAIKIVDQQNFKRPIVRSIHKYLGKGHDLYGGRKGFVDLMLSRKQSLENISVWMGHTSLHRTWRSYKNKKVYQFY